MIQPLGRQKGTTERGNSFVLSQWAPNVIQLTIQRGNNAISETLENIRSENEMIERRNALEDEFIAWITPPPENTNEVTN